MQAFPDHLKGKTVYSFQRGTTKSGIPMLNFFSIDENGDPKDLTGVIGCRIKQTRSTKYVSPPGNDWYITCRGYYGIAPAKELIDEINTNYDAQLTLKEIR